MIKSMARTGLKDWQDLQVGNVVVGKLTNPRLNIWVEAGYEIVESVGSRRRPRDGAGTKDSVVDFLVNGTRVFLATEIECDLTRYLKVYSPRYHTKSGPVVVTAEEMGLVMLKDELTEAIWLAIPGFFWVVVAATFATNYNSQYGGNFWEAFFRHDVA